MRRDDWKGNRSGGIFFAMSLAGNTARRDGSIYYYY